MVGKEGLQTAIDFTKYLLTLAGGAIAFVIQPTFFAGSDFLKLLSIASIVLLTICVITGLLVFSRGCVMLAEKDYNLEDKRIKYLGMTNVISFGMSFVLLALAVAIKVLSV
jgi:hypothetical protein